jgi:hypothetical protein
MDDDVFAIVVFFPGEIVMILDIQENSRAEALGDVLVNERVVRGCVTAHEVHGVPIFLTGFGIERQPGKAFKFAVEVGMRGNGSFRIIIANGGAGSAAAAVSEKREVFAGGEVADLFARGEKAEFDKMIAAAAGAELGPGAIFVLFGDGTDGPIGVHDFVLASDFVEARADAEASFGFDGFDESVRFAVEFARGPIEHGHFHSARDIHSNGIWNDRAFHRKNPADGQTIADMGVGHESALHRNRQEAGAFHLHDGFVLKVPAPLLVGNGFFARRRRGFDEGAGEFATQVVFNKRCRIAKHCGDLLFQPIFFSRKNEFGNERDGVAH